MFEPVPVARVEVLDTVQNRVVEVLEGEQRILGGWVAGPLAGGVRACLAGGHCLQGALPAGKP